MDEKQERFNWDDVERDYKAGLLSLGMICAKYSGLSLVNLRKVAAKMGWERAKVDPPPPVVPQGGGVPPQDVITRQDAFRIQAQQILEIVKLHQRDVNKVRGLAALLTERLALVIEGADVEKPLLGGRESVSDVLLKLAKVTFSAVRMEREILGLSTYQAPESSEDEGGDWDEAKRILEEALSTKRGEAHDSDRDP